MASAIPAILTVMASVTFAQAYPIQLGKVGFSFGTRHGGYKHQNANGGDANVGNGGDANGGDAVLSHSSNK